MLLPSKMMGLLWWHQFDGLDISVTSWTTTLQLSVHFLIKRQLYYIQSIWSRKNKPCPLISLFNILFLSEVRHNTGSKNGRKNFRFTRTLKPFHSFRCKHTCSVYQLLCLCSSVLFSQQFSQCTAGVTEELRILVYFNSEGVSGTFINWII